MTLRRAVEIVAYKDAQPFRQAVFAYLAGHQPAARGAQRLYAALRAAPAVGGAHPSAALVAAYGLLAFLRLELPRGHRMVAVGEYRNEERQFAWLEAVLGEELGRASGDGRLALRAESARALAALLAEPALLREALAHVAEVDRAHADFLVSARCAQTAGVWLRARQLLRGHDARAILVSSDSNPLAMGVAWAARDAGRRTVYINHGHIPDGPPRLDFDLSILDGPALLRVYEESQGYAGAVVYKGAEGEQRPMDTAGLRADRPLVLGVFMSLIVDWPAFGALFQRIRAALRPARVILRLHPNEVIRDPRALDHLDLDAAVEVSRGEAVLTHEAARCDLVLAGNSSAHLTLLRYGVPTACLPGMDLVPHDFYRFLRLGIVPEVPAPEALDRLALAAFFDDPAWAGRFRSFDAGYQAEELSPGVRAAVRALLERA